MSERLGHRPTRLRIPHPHASESRSGHDMLAVRAKTGRMHEAAVLNCPGPRLPVPGIPDQRRSKRNSNDPFTIRAELRRLDIAIVVDRLRDGLAALRIPQSRSVVLRCRDYQL